MGFFQNLANDLAMGFGAKPKTKDFEARTARTIARNEGFNDVNQSANAMRYMDRRGVTQADIGNMSASTAPGYTSIRDRFDGGGMGMSGARFSRGNVANFDTDGDNYISEQEYVAAEKNFPDQFKTSTMGGIPSLTNRLGARPLGSYNKERNLFRDTGVPGTNIGTSGPADYLIGGGFIGNMLRGGKPNRMQQVNPLMERDARLTPEAVDAATPVTTRQEGPLRVKGPGLSEKVEKTVQQYTNPVLSYPKDEFGNVVLDPMDMQINGFARGGIVSLVRR